MQAYARFQTSTLTMIDHLTRTTSCAATLVVGPHRASPFAISSNEISLRVLVDRSVVEAFAAGGRAVVTRRIYPGVKQDQLFALNSGESGEVLLAGLEAFVLDVPTVMSESDLRAM